MGFIIKILVTAVPQVLALLNTILKPVLVLLTIPVTIFTLGLVFLLFIDAIIVKLVHYFKDGFTVHGWLSTILFNIIISVDSYLSAGLTLRY